MKYVLFASHTKESWPSNGDSTVVFVCVTVDLKVDFSQTLLMRETRWYQQKSSRFRSPDPFSRLHSDGIFFNLEVLKVPSAHTCRGGFSEHREVFFFPWGVTFHCGFIVISAAFYIRFDKSISLQLIVARAAFREKSAGLATLLRH